MTNVTSTDDTLADAGIIVWCKVHWEKNLLKFIWNKENL